MRGGSIEGRQANISSTKPSLSRGKSGEGGVHCHGNNGSGTSLSLSSDRLSTNYICWRQLSSGEKKTC